LNNHQHYRLGNKSNESGFERRDIVGILCVAGVWIINGKDVFYNQYSTVTFLCPMRFERYPLDEHICRFLF